MKGYNTSNGYMGYVEGKYILFASEQEYFEFMHYRGYIYVILELVFAFCASQWPLVRLPVATWRYEWPEVNRPLCVRS